MRLSFVVWAGLIRSVGCGWQLQRLIRVAGDAMGLVEPASQIDQPAALAAEWLERGSIPPDDRAAAMGTGNASVHGCRPHHTQQVSRKGRSSVTGVGRPLGSGFRKRML